MKVIIYFSAIFTVILFSYKVSQCNIDIIFIKTKNID